MKKILWLYVCFFAGIMFSAGQLCGSHVDPQVILQHAKMQMELKERFARQRMQEEPPHERVAEPVLERAVGRPTQLESFLGVEFQDPNATNNFLSLLKRKLAGLEFTGSRAEPYIELLTKANDRARVHKETHYYVVHAHGAGPALVNILQTMLVEKFSLMIGQNIHLRMGSSVQTTTMDEFFEATTSQFGPGRIHDHVLRDELLSCNFCIFGGYPHYENSFFVFSTGGSIFDPTQLIEAAIFTPLGLNPEFISLIRRVLDSYVNKGLRHNFIQIFLPKHRINDFVYISRPFGSPVVDIDYRDVAAYLEAYITRPDSIGIEKMRYNQARVVLLPGLYKEAKMFTYNLMSEEDNRAFKRNLEEIIDEAINQWIESGAYRRLLGHPHYGRLARLVDLYVQGQAAREEEETRIERETPRPSGRGRARGLQRKMIIHLARVQTAEDADALVEASDQVRTVLRRLAAVDQDSAQEFTELLKRRFNARGRELFDQRYGPDFKMLMTNIRQMQDAASKREFAAALTRTVLRGSEALTARLRQLTAGPEDVEQARRNILILLLRAAQKIVQDIKKIAPSNIGQRFERELERARAVVEG